MFKTILKQIFWIILICLTNKQVIAITGEEISTKVSNWLDKEGINGSPVFSKKRSFKDCRNDIEIKKMFQNYKTIKAKCLDKDGFEILMRVKILKTNEVENKINSKVKISNSINKNKTLIKKTGVYKTIKLKKSLEKNDIIEMDDIETVIVEKKHQTSFFSDKKALVGRKLKKNLKMGQILHPRHLLAKFDINNGDAISIVSNVGNASVTVTGEAQDSGNLGDLIKVKNLKSGKIVKGYIKKNKIIKIFR